MLSATSMARLWIRLASCAYSVPVPQLVNYRYRVVQLRNMQKYNVISIFKMADHLPEICTLFCIRLPNLVPIEEPTAEIWRHIYLSRWRPRPLNTTSGFVFVDVTAFRRQWHQQTKFCGDISNGGWDISSSGFEIQTSAILEFYFWFLSRRVRRNLHVILHQDTEFRPNRRTHCGNRRHICFSRWRQRPLNTTSGFVFVDVAAFRRAKSISKPNFVEISPLAAEI